VIHYHGGPITPETCALRAWQGRHAFIRWGHHAQVELAASVCQSFALDNGAFSVWRRGDPPPHWPDYYDWCAHWLSHPACDWAVIPDVIGGTEAENDALVDEWPTHLAGVPVWHLDESPERLVRLADRFPRVALGSAAEFDVKRPMAAVARLAAVLPHISDDAGRPLVKLHGLRMLNPAVITRVPLASGDSTNVGRNIGIDKAWRGSYAPATKEARVDVLVQLMESHPTPDRMVPLEQPPPTLFDDES